MKRSEYMLAALASAVLPNLGVSGVRANVQPSATDEANGIDQTVVQDASGKSYDVYATTTKEGRSRLIRRVKAAQTLDAAREPGGLGFELDHVIAFARGDVSQPGQTATAQALGRQARQEDETPRAAKKPGPTGETTVMVTTHNDGEARSLDLLTLDDCTAVGTAIGAIHRLSPAFLSAAKYPVFTTGQIRAQLTAWIRRLRNAGHVPTEITDSWARIMETEGLWSFTTCTVHGGFSDGDFLFSNSTITAVTNWQDMQVNDPARDLAWIFGKLDENHRNAVLSAYGRMMGSRLDDLIMLRANLWLQMEQVGDFIQALNRADNDRIVQFKAQVERLAHQLGVMRHETATTVPAAGAAAKPGSPSTITVGALLQDQQRPASAQPQASRSASATQTVQPAATQPASATRPVSPMQTAATIAQPNDDTPDPDKTGSAEIVAAGDVDVTGAEAADRTDNHPQTAMPYSASDKTGSSRVQTPNAVESSAAYTAAGSSSVTITLKELIDMNDAQSGAVKEAKASGPATGTIDATGTATGTRRAANATTDARPTQPVNATTSSNLWHGSHSSPDAQTTVIPLLEREERALRDARAGLDGYDSEGNPLSR
ncbi:phosphotransferase [Bifidobacterium scaligerum]|uniref:Aminoglycoside phosphotransferase n=1 Tax=Bifidobacterium scaligerum TaxID=2052656 RepID=A0A2M9HR58_9BIFI|nr:phosphotransferase [Bifidobacterium scaligerum]PJM79306.1 aminoglycoside phosphotransferase [Bifidobacterium scaligerum]